MSTQRERARESERRYDSRNRKKRRTANSARYAANREREQERHREYYRVNRESIIASKIADHREEKALDPVAYARRLKNVSLRRLYGLTIEEFEKIVSDQSGKCAICHEQFDDRPKGKHVDHDHTVADKRLAVRAVLCSHCNVMLARAKDNPDVLMRGAEYLIAHRKRQKGA